MANDKKGKGCGWIIYSAILRKKIHNVLLYGVAVDKSVTYRHNTSNSISQPK
ncbi:unnamed protein product [Sphenostylis stenocarpa]|uniref:Uncharacterized protein n=1 Tax=Sphenostylis stenocarpa TaxID=92480 RepID=A0AA86VXS9_9FABA|nr:unnamed protein product [Sphenostylis stenocarpa]